jgi:hypothetical protein
LDLGFWISLENLDAHIRTHHTTNSTPGAFALRVVEHHILVPLVVDRLLQANEGVWTDLDAKDAPFALHFIYFDGRH